MNFTEDQFTNGTDVLMYLSGLPNELDRIREFERLDKIAKNYKIKSFKKQWETFQKQIKEITCSNQGGNTTEFEGLDGFNINSGSWKADEEGVSIIGNYGTELFACSHPILPIQRLIDVDTNEEKLKLAYKRGKRSWREIIVDKRVLASGNGIIELASHGIAVNSENSKLMVKYLHDIESINYESIEEKLTVSRLGWINNFGFSPYVDNLTFNEESNDPQVIKSIKENGDINKWMDLAKKVRANGITSRMILASSFSSVLIEKIGGLPFFVHLCGTTGTGKTVGLMFAASVWANPKSEGGYIKSFKNTDVFVERFASFLNSMPMILDEFQLIKEKKNHDTMIYALTQGSGKGRGKKTGGVERTGSWRNCILTSGEQAITSFSSGGGAVNRIIEIECDEPIFEDPRWVVDTIKENYGFGGKILVEWLNKEENVKKSKEIYEDFFQSFQNKDTTQKQVMAMCMILTADRIITDVIFQDNNCLTTDEVIQFMKTKSAVSNHQRGYEYLLENIAMNSKKFGEEVFENWGALDSGTCYIVRSIFDKICNDGGFNPASLLKWMKKSAKIDTGDKGYTKSKRINKMPVNCVWLKREHDIVNEDDDF